MTTNRGKTNRDEDGNNEMAKLNKETTWKPGELVDMDLLMEIRGRDGVRRHKQRSLRLEMYLLKLMGAVVKDNPKGDELIPWSPGKFVDKNIAHKFKKNEIPKLRKFKANNIAVEKIIKGAMEK